MKKKKNKSFNIVEFFKKNSKMLILGIIALILFNKYVLLISVMLFFYFAGMATMQVSRLVPHINIECISAGAAFIGYIWGWELGLAFGVIVGVLGWVKVSLIKHTTLTTTLFMGMAGAFSALFAELNFGFVAAFILAFIVRTPISYFIMAQITSDPIENFIHSVGDSVFTMIVYSQLCNILYIIIKPFL